MYLKILIALSLILLSAMARADALVPDVGAVDVHDKYVDVSFYLSQKNIEALQATFSEEDAFYPADERASLARFFDHALDINVTFPNNSFIELKRIFANNLEQDLDSLWRSRIYDEGVVVRPDITWQFNQTGIRPGSQIFVRDATTGSENSLLVMRAHYLQPWKWYTVRFEFEDKIPEGTDVEVNITPMRDEQGLYLTVPILEDARIDPLGLGVELADAMIGEPVGNAMEIAFGVFENFDIIQEGIFTQAFITIFGRKSGTWRLTDNFKALSLSMGKGLKNGVLGFALSATPALNAAEHLPFGASRTFNSVKVSNSLGYLCWSDSYPNGSELACNSTGTPPENNVGSGPVVGGGESNDDPDSGTESPGTGDDDLSIKRFEIKEKGQDSWRHSIDKTMAYGEHFYLDGELKLANKGDGEAEDVDIDYRIDHGRNFDTDDTKVDEDEEDIDAGDSIIKHVRDIKIEVSSDGNMLNVYKNSGSFAESFPIENNFAKFYIFVDAEAKSGDDDISSKTSKHNEYGVVRITVDPNLAPPVPPQPTVAEGYSNSICAQAGYSQQQCGAILDIILD